MSQIASQPISTPQVRYSKPTKTEVEKPHINGATILTDREKRLHDIAFLTQYVEDLRAGRPVDNISPSNDPYFLVPENIESMIKADIYMLNGGICREISVKDIVGDWEWDTE